MKVLIVDDEPLARTRLRQQVEVLDGFGVAGEAGNGIEAIEQMNVLQAQILLLDIRMPGMSGLEVGRHLSGLENPPAIIFTTAYGEHALEAFETHAVDYLLKPIRPEKLQAALLAAKKLSRAQILGVDKVEEAGRSHICARVRGNLKLIDLHDIYYFKADSKYVEVRHTGGEVLIEEPLTALEEEFGGRFLRVHRNALVAPDRLASLAKDDEGHAHVCFTDIDAQIEVSRRHLPRVRALFKR